MPLQSPTYNGNWMITRSTGVYVGNFIGFIESSGHARGGRAPRGTTARRAIILRLRFGNGGTELFPLDSLTKTQNEVTYDAPPS